MKDRLIITTKKKQEREFEKRLAEIMDKNSKRYEMDLLMKQTNIAVLQSQINPHFLYNALECIRGQAIISGADSVAEITDALSRYFRYSVSDRGETSTLISELDNIDNYIKIQQFRFRDRFTVERHFEQREFVSNAVLPKLTLQPIIENAVVHGFSDITSGGKIFIDIKHPNNNLDIIISDNGKGIPANRLEQINRELRSQESGLLSDDASGHTGIGMNNVNRRLKLMFGMEYGINITSLKGLGTSVEIFIPVVFSEKTNDR